MSTKADYGEPWMDVPWQGRLSDRVGNTPLASLGGRERAMACVNALAGIPDPAAWVREVKAVLEWYTLGGPPKKVVPWGTVEDDLYDRARSLLAQMEGK